MSFLRWITVFTVVQYVLTSVAGLKTFYFSDLCPFDNGIYSQTVNLGGTWKDYNSSAILKAKRYATYPTGLSCFVTIKPPLGYGVVVAIRSTDLRIGCEIDNLTIVDYFGGRTTFCNYNFFSQEYRSTYSTNRLIVEFRTGRSSLSTLFRDGFQLTVTSYKMYPCSSSEFECSNLRCVAKELTCDGHNHCGDSSDQLRCGVRSVGGIVGVVFGCVFVLIAVIAGVVYCRSRRNRRITTTTIHSPPPPPPPQPMYPPYGTMYPQPGSCPPPPQYSATPHQQEAVNPLYK